MSTFLAWLFFIGAIVASVFYLIEKSKRLKESKRQQDTIQQLQSQYAQLDAERQNVMARNAFLSRYEGIVEIEAQIEKLQNDFNTKFEQLKREEEDAKRSLRESKKETDRLQAETLSRATEESARIIQEAHSKAEEIAGDAYQALQQANHLKETVKAIENSLKGYGDEYLIPNHAALDDLADEYTHKQAGIDLKTARARTREMVKAGTAAACDYAETNRKTTAIRFVLDAFNGKVDSAISTVRHNNYGKLKQEILDAYSLVNEHGKAFRNARINPEYVESRLNELKWAVAVMELQQQEREEQRRIKQEMREEERARREYEKAIKQAEKEEKLLKKLMQEAQAKLDSASAEERAEYERKIQELEKKYQEAEEKNQRAISMAQQTKRGHVYVISNIGSFGDDVFKIGLTRRLEPMDRVKELGDASVPFDFDVHAMIYNEDAPKLESTLHQVFSDFQLNKVNARKEFFKVGIGEIRNVLEEIGIEAKWTMTAEAAEYRESLALAHEASTQEVRNPCPEIVKVLAISNSIPPEDYSQLKALS